MHIYIIIDKPKPKPPPKPKPKATKPKPNIVKRKPTTTNLSTPKTIGGSVDKRYKNKQYTKANGTRDQRTTLAKPATTPSFGCASRLSIHTQLLYYVLMYTNVFDYIQAYKYEANHLYYYIILWVMITLVEGNKYRYDTICEKYQPERRLHVYLSASSACEPVGTDAVPLVSPSNVAKDTVVFDWCVMVSI
jgi:hypothetical protein